LSDLDAILNLEHQPSPGRFPCPTSQAARVVVIAQMILDLVVLGLVVKVFLGAVETGRRRQTTQQDPELS
jgi:hypothetical protein